MPKKSVYTKSLDFARNKLHRSGFTLVELLVTITIIAVLAAIGLVVYSVALKQGRDSKRQTDLRAIQSALEQYNSDQLFYPTTAGLNGLLAQPTPSPFTSNTGNPSPLPNPKTYLNSPPKDPTGTISYKYEAFPADPPPCDNGVSVSSRKCTSYCLYANLENLPSPPPSAPAGCSYPAGYDFAVSLP